MPFIPVNNVVAVNIRYLLDDQRIENTLYVQYGTNPTSDNLEDVASAVVDWFDEVLSPYLSNDIVLREVYTYDMTSATAESYTRVPNTPLAGKVIARSVSNAQALCISFRSNGRGRGTRGRNYVTGMPDSTLVQNTFSPDIVSNIVGAYRSLFALLTTSGERVPVVVSRYINKQPRPLGVAYPITAVLAVDNIVDSQRRRTPGRGE